MLKHLIQKLKLVQPLKYVKPITKHELEQRGTYSLTNSLSPGYQLMIVLINILIRLKETNVLIRTKEQYNIFSPMSSTKLRHIT